RAGPRQHGRGAELVAALPGAGEDTAVGEEARLVDEFLTVGPAGHLSRRHLRILSVHRAIWRSYDSPRACEPRRPCDAIMTAHQRTSRRTGWTMGGTGFMGLGGWELVVLLIVFLVIVGPQRLPEVTRQLVQWVRQARRWVEDSRSTVEDEMGIAIEDL